MNRKLYYGGAGAVIGGMLGFLVMLGSWWSLAFFAMLLAGGAAVMRADPA